MLWRFHLQSKEGGAKVNRIQLPLVFFLELLALLLLATAAAGPRWNVRQSARPLIVVLDDSFSMRAVAEGKSSRDRAIEFLERRVETHPPSSIRLLLSGADPQLLGNPVKTWSQAGESLGGWNCMAPMSALDAAILLSADLGNQQANILVLTDHAPQDPAVAGDRLEWHAFGRPLDNIAFVNAARSAHEDQDRCLLEVANYSPRTASPQVSVQTASNRIEVASITIGAGERQKVAFNIPSSAPLLTARLASDVLAEDNQVRLLPPIRKRVRVQVSLTHEPLTRLVSDTLDATGLRASISDNPELLIHHSAVAPSGSNTWSLSWPLVTNASAFAGPFVIDTGHPLAQGLGLQGVVWSAAPLSATNFPLSVPILLSGNTPLLSVREDALGRRHLALNLDLQLSTIQNTPDWPALFWNLLHWRAGETPGLLESNARLDTEVLLKTTGEPVEVTWPDGTRKSFAQTGDELALETPLPGLYSVRMGTALYSLAVNAVASEESDLSGASTGSWGQWNEDGAAQFESASTLWMFALGALGVMAAHLMLVTGPRAGREAEARALPGTGTNARADPP
jgi:hypothetical protein